jgi:protocatechuate 3,4-dioxygenase beta subunit
MPKSELRREFLRFGVAAATALVWDAALDAADCAETEDNIEGPFYKAGAPERSSLWEPGMDGTRLTVTGQVLDTNCQPIPYATMDAWQCDAKGVYDNAGYHLRGKLKTDGKGRFQLVTIVPPAYKISSELYRPAHIHLKLSAPGTPLLTTQLYFEGDKWNRVDRAYRKSLTINPTEGLNGAREASFDFHLRRQA